MCFILLNCSLHCPWKPVQECVWMVRVDKTKKHTARFVADAEAPTWCRFFVEEPISPLKSLRNQLSSLIVEKPITSQVVENTISTSGLPHVNPNPNPLPRAPDVLPFFALLIGVVFRERSSGPPRRWLPPTPSPERCRSPSWPPPVSATSPHPWLWPPVPGV